MNGRVHIKSGLIDNPNETVACPYSEGEPDYGAFLQGNTEDGYIQYDYQYDYYTGESNSGEEDSGSGSGSGC